jgi:hypothetical protein
VEPVFDFGDIDGSQSGIPVKVYFVNAACLTMLQFGVLFGIADEKLL